MTNIITWELDPTIYDNVQLRQLLEVAKDMNKSIATQISDYLENIESKEEEVPVTLATIKNTCGWKKYCDITGANHYMLNEWDVSDREILNVKLSHAKLLGLCI